MPCPFLGRDLGRGEAAIVMRVERGFVKVFIRRMRISMRVGEGVDERRQATKGAERCAAPVNRQCDDCWDLREHNDDDDEEERDGKSHGLGTWELGVIRPHWFQPFSINDAAAQMARQGACQFSVA